MLARLCLAGLLALVIVGCGPDPAEVRRQAEAARVQQEAAAKRAKFENHFRAAAAAFDAKSEAGLTSAVQAMLAEDEDAPIYAAEKAADEALPTSDRLAALAVVRRSGTHFDAVARILQQLALQANVQEVRVKAAETLAEVVKQVN